MTMHPAISVALWWLTAANILTLAIVTERWDDRPDVLDVWARTFFAPVLILMRISRTERAGQAVWDLTSRMVERTWAAICWPLERILR